MITMARLGDVCEKASSNIAQKDLNGHQGEYAIYGANGLIKYVDFYQQDKPYIAIVKDGAGIGRIMKLPAETSVIGTLQYIMPSSDIDIDYLAYAMEHMNLAKYSTGSTIPHIYFKDYKNEILPLPALNEQKKIGGILDKIDKYIMKNRQQFDKLNELVKSRFIELFGDPYKNPFNWKRSTIANVMRASASNGFFAKPDDYSENGNVGVIFVADVVNRKYSNIANLRKTTVSDRDLDKYRVQYGDMLFCRSSLVKEGIGKASVIPENVGKNIIFECHVIRIPLDMDVVIPEFMQALSATNYFRNMMMSNSKTATMTTIGQKGIITAEIYIPPVELQKEFLLFNKQIDKSKLTIQKSLEKLEILKKSLMQQYFG